MRLVTATTKITTSATASLSTGSLCHLVTCSGRYLEKPCNVALFHCSFPHNAFFKRLFCSRNYAVSSDKLP